MEKLQYRDIAKKYGIGVTTAYSYVKKLFPEKVIKAGRMNPTYFTEQEAEMVRDSVMRLRKNKVKYQDDKIAILIINSYEVIIDSEDLDRVLKHWWRLVGTEDRLYFGYFIYTRNKLAKEGEARYKGKPISLHRFIMNAKKGELVDHKDGNTLDNRKSNLRICTISENSCNRKISKNNKSGYKGVHWHKRYKKWRASIGKNRKQYTIGSYNTPEEAYAAYCKAAKELHGEFARLE